MQLRYVRFKDIDTLELPNATSLPTFSRPRPFAVILLNAAEKLATPVGGRTKAWTQLVALASLARCVALARLILV